MNLKRFFGRDFVTALVAVVLGLLAGAVLMALIGRNPISGYVYPFGQDMSIERVGNTLATATHICGFRWPLPSGQGFSTLALQGRCLWRSVRDRRRLTLVLPQTAASTVMVAAAILGADGDRCPAF